MSLRKQNREKKKARATEDTEDYIQTHFWSVDTEYEGEEGGKRLRLSRRIKKQQQKDRDNES